MAFEMKYPIRADFITKGTKRRSGTRMPKVGFIVSHDTGNDGSTAAGNVKYYKNSANDMSASAHLFVDDKEIVECIPALTTSYQEKAWHVLYNRGKDNAMYGDDSNDIAIGVELAYSWKKGSIDNQEAYKKYVWLLAYICYKFDLNPLKHITGHQVLDPGRKTDPDNALKKYGKSLEILIQDVKQEYDACLGKTVSASVAKPVTNSKYAGVLLKEGSKGDQVKELQDKLLRLGINVDVDSVFGRGTSNAVMIFQGRVGLEKDGLAGENTLTKLDETLAKRDLLNPKEEISEYKIYTGVLKDEKQAEELAAKIGYNAYVQDGRIWTGTFRLLSSAEIAHSEILSKFGLNPTIRKIK